MDAIWFMDPKQPLREGSNIKKNKNTFAKLQRERQKKRKAEEKRQRKMERKSGLDTKPIGEGELSESVNSKPNNTTAANSAE